MKKVIISLVAALMFAVTLQTVSALSPAQSDYYSDVFSAQRYFQAIEFITEEGIVNGYDDGTYKPDGLLNRAELLKIIIEAEYEDEFEAYSNVSCFDDVDAGEWFTSYVCFAKDEGFVVGYSDDTFRPTDEINLVEAVKIAMEVFGYEYMETEPWYKGPIDVAADGNFIPLDFISFDQYMDRGEMADLITRVLKEESGEQSDYLGIWEPYVVSFDNLSSNADTEPAYCVGDMEYILVGDGYRPMDFDDKWCDCQADGTFVCQTDDPVVCTQDAMICSDGSSVGRSGPDCEFDACPSELTCEFGGETYEVGDEFPDTDSCNTCECDDAGGNVGVSCTEINCPLTLLMQVCGNDGEGACTEDKVAEHGCDYGYEATFGGNEFVKCGMWDTTSADVLVFDGGLGSVGYNLIGDDGVGDLDVIDSVEDLALFWGEIADGEDALEFAMAATFDHEAYSETDIEDLYGVDFAFVQDVALEFSDPIEVQDVLIAEWIIPLYYSPTFGCTPFPVTEIHYTVTEDGTISTFADHKIGEIDNGMCVD
jgi:S-layer family protein